MSTNLPSLRYMSFVEVFEKRMTRIQELAKAAEMAEQPYNILKELLLNMKIEDRDHSLAIDDMGDVILSIIAQPNDLFSQYQYIQTMINDRLQEASLTKEKTLGAARFDYPVWSVRWRCEIKKFREAAHPMSIRFKVDLPNNGIRDITFKSEERSFSYTQRSEVILKHPRPYNWHMDRESQRQGSEEVQF